jgi:macrodomain Ter protein organizer (MatP/YcbG family)
MQGANRARRKREAPNESSHNKSPSIYTCYVHIQRCGSVRREAATGTLIFVVTLKELLVERVSRQKLTDDPTVITRRERMHHDVAEPLEQSTVARVDVHPLQGGNVDL